MPLARERERENFLKIALACATADVIRQPRSLATRRDAQNLSDRFRQGSNAEKRRFCCMNSKHGRPFGWSLQKNIFLENCLRLCKCRQTAREDGLPVFRIPLEAEMTKTEEARGEF